MTRPISPESALPDLGLTARVTGPRPRLDPRSAIATGAITDVALAGVVASARYTAPAAMQCVVPRTAMRHSSDSEAMAVSELLWGEGFDLFEVADEWGFGRSIHDRYTGWVPMAALGEARPAASHRITARVAPLFRQPDIKAAVIAELPFGARVEGAVSGRFLAVAGGGFVHVRHIASLAATPVEVARRFIGAPYLWGGRSPIGVDCSGLVQAALQACGIEAPRDSDQQRDHLGTAVDLAERRSGDLVFFPGHVGMLVDADTLLHANAWWMAVLEEPLADVIARGAEVTAVRRV